MGRQAGTAALLSAAATVAVCVLLLCAGYAAAIDSASRLGASSARALASAAARAREASRAQISRRASAELEDPLSTQDASIDLDSAAGDEEDVVDFADGNAEGAGALRQEPLPARELPSPIAIEGSIMAMPAGAAPVDMSVVPEPVPRVDAMEPPISPSLRRD